ncbi:MAG: M28 family peptidase [Verrucomicrobiota bacterium]|nr:M28 family peptidase [Verrucomicrobiota bacterium]
MYYKSILNYLRIFKIFCLFLILFFTGSCKKEELKPKRKILFDSKNAMKLLVKQVEIGPRPSNSENLKKTADWIAQKCRDYGFSTEMDSWKKKTPSGTKTFHNVIARLVGDDDRRIILGAHFDTKVLREYPFFLGANDAASGVAVILEIMRVLGQFNDWHGASVDFCFFDGEECFNNYSDNDGLHGSRRYAKKLQNAHYIEKYIAVIILDMIADKQLTVTLPMDTDKNLASQLFEIAREQKVKHCFSFLTGKRIIDDHTPFQRLGIPSIDIIDFQFGPGNMHWHTAGDNLSNVSEKSLEIIGRVTYKLIMDLAKE